MSPKLLIDEQQEIIPTGGTRRRKPIDRLTLTHFDIDLAIAAEEHALKAYHYHAECDHRRRKGDLHKKCADCRGYICDYDHRCPDCKTMNRRMFGELRAAYRRKEQARKAAIQKAREERRTPPPFYTLPYYDDSHRQSPKQIERKKSRNDSEIKRSRKIEPLMKGIPPRKIARVEEKYHHRSRSRDKSPRERKTLRCSLTRPRDETRSKQSRTPEQRKRQHNSINQPISRHRTTLRHMEDEQTLQKATLSSPSEPRKDQKLATMIIDPRSSHFYNQLSRLASYLNASKQPVHFQYDKTLKFSTTVVCSSNRPITQVNKYKVAPAMVAEHSVCSPRHSTDEPDDDTLEQPVATQLPVRLTDLDRLPPNKEWSDSAAANRIPVKESSFTEVPDIDENLPTLLGDEPTNEEMFPLQAAIVELAHHLNVELSDVATISNTSIRKSGLPTHPKIKIWLKARQGENSEQDKAPPGRKYATVKPTNILKVNHIQYESADTIAPIDALVWPDEHRIWMPAPFRCQTDIPLCEREARYLERLTRVLIRILSLQHHTIDGLGNILAPTTPKAKVKSTTLTAHCLALLEHTSADAAKVAIELLNSIINLRRDALLMHSRIPPEAALWLRSRTYDDSYQLFESCDIHRVHEYTARHMLKVTPIIAPKTL